MSEQHPEVGSVEHRFCCLAWIYTLLPSWVSCVSFGRLLNLSEQ